jgi:hypothetical protein
MKVKLIRSSTWIGDDYEAASRTLEETIQEFVFDNDRIINIEVKERNGASRFWLYVEEGPNIT